MSYIIFLILSMKQVKFILFCFFPIWAQVRTYTLVWTCYYWKQQAFFSSLKVLMNTCLGKTSRGDPGQYTPRSAVGGWMVGLLEWRAGGESLSCPPAAGGYTPWSKS